MHALLTGRQHLCNIGNSRGQSSAPGCWGYDLVMLYLTAVRTSFGLFAAAVKSFCHGYLSQVADYLSQVYSSHCAEFLSQVASLLVILQSCLRCAEGSSCLKTFYSIRLNACTNMHICRSAPSLQLRKHLWPELCSGFLGL
jgi:hypothetical protein